MKFLIEVQGGTKADQCMLIDALIHGSETDGLMCDLQIDSVRLLESYP